MLISFICGTNFKFIFTVKKFLKRIVILVLFVRLVRKFRLILVNNLIKITGITKDKNNSNKNFHLFITHNNSIKNLKCHPFHKIHLSSKNNPFHNRECSDFLYIRPTYLQKILIFHFFLHNHKICLHKCYLLYIFHHLM